MRGISGSGALRRDGVITLSSSDHRSGLDVVRFVLCSWLTPLSLRRAPPDGDDATGRQRSVNG
ncbi:hypothetical protein KCP78_25810 [Salmonella enterica subsp. enterica]|nr:hypothetical protein KCP78_25810 [Salmonella enterica subsp. enterica]